MAVILKREQWIAGRAQKNVRIWQQPTGQSGQSPDASMPRRRNEQATSHAQGAMSHGIHVGRTVQQHSQLAISVERKRRPNRSWKKFETFKSASAENSMGIVASSSSVNLPHFIATQKTPNMKLGILLVIGFAFITSIHAQGPLPPPGAPAPSMKSLDQIEARTPISSAPITISSGGSYYLTRNLTVPGGNAIVITASNVTLDLNGFTISSTADPALGTCMASLPARNGIVIRNGTIRGSVVRSGSTYSGAGFQDAISMVSSVGVQVEKIHISGILSSGISLPTTNSHVKNCLVVTCGGTGIQAESVEECTVTDIGGVAINSKIATKCVGANEVGTADGIAADIVTDCRGSCVAGSGISAKTVNNSYGISSNGIGIEATTANNSQGDSTIGTGIVATTVNNSTGTSITGHGINASMAVMNSFGFGGGTGDSIRCTGGVVTNSFGKLAPSGTGVGMRALTANGSRGANSSDAVSQVITNKYNMP